MSYDYDKRVGKKIRSLRIERGLTQEQIAARLQINGYDLTRGSLAKIEAGVRHIYLYELYALRELFQVSFDELLG